MDQKQSQGQSYFCPMHPAVRQPTPGKCTKCGMDLVPTGTRFGMLRHVIGSPLHLVIMAAVMAAVMIAAMMMMR